MLYYRVPVVANKSEKAVVVVTIPLSSKCDVEPFFLKMESFSIIHVSNVSLPTPFSGTAVLVVLSSTPNTSNIVDVDGCILKIILIVKQDNPHDSTAKVSAYEAQYTLQQIASDLKVYDENFLKHIEERTPNENFVNADIIKFRELQYLVELLKHVNITSNTSVDISPKTFDQKEGMISSCFFAFDIIPSTIDSAAHSQLRFAIKERLPNTMVRIIYSTILACVDDGPEHLKGRISATTVYDLTVRLVEEQTKILEQVSSKQHNYYLLERNRDGWKDTAEKLSGQWEIEKSQLFQNFCELYTNKKNHDAQIIKQLQAEISVLKEQLAKVNSTSSHPSEFKRPTVKVKSEVPEVLQDIPDDHNNVFDDETVRRLAQGQRIPVPAIKMDDTFESDKFGNETRKRNYNPISGATEYMDADDALKDIIQPKDTSSLQITKKSRSDTVQRPTSKMENVEIPIKPTRMEPASTALTVNDHNNQKSHSPSLKKKRKTNSTSINEQNDGGSDTGSDNDFIDKTLEAQILADLEALRKP